MCSVASGDRSHLSEPRVFPGGIPWRSTFLRRHLAEELRDCSEILVLRDLQDRGYPVTPFHFFFAEPDYRLYQPLHVRPFDQKGNGDPQYERRYRARPDATPVFDLTGLIRVLRETPQDGRSVLLEARSGAGKSVAGRAVLFDCLYANAADGGGPRLSGYLPCILRKMQREGALAEVLRGDSRAKPRVLFECLARTADLDDVPGAVDRVATWLEAGPPLLLLADLNAVAPDVRPILATAIIDFLRSSEARRAGHRAIVTYRSHAQDDTLRQLRVATWDSTRTGGGDRIFVQADLEPMDTRATSHYLDSLRSVEALLAGTRVDQGGLAREMEVVRELASRFDSGEGSLISTPLMLYFVGALGGDRLRDARSLAALYGAVAEEFLRREEQAELAANPPAEPGTGFDPSIVRAAMGRLALLLLAQGPGTVRLVGPAAAETNLNALFQVPEKAFVKLLPGRTLDEIDPYWRSGPYLNEKLPPILDRTQGRGIGERSFLRRTEDGVGFLHDSFLYYFAASALRYSQDPDPEFLLNAVDADWREAVVRWWQRDPARWPETAEFLAGMLSHEDLLELVASLLILPPTIELIALTYRLIRGRERSGTVADASPLVQLEQALRRPEVQRWPICLHSLVANWLIAAAGEGRDSECLRFIQTLGAAETRRGGSAEILVAMPPVPLPGQDHRCHRAAVSYAEALPDGKVASIDRENLLIVWDPASGRILRFPGRENYLGPHRPQLLELSGDRLLYVDSSGNIGLYPLGERPGRQPGGPSILAGLAAPLRMRKLPDDRVLLQDGDGAVWVVSPGRDGPLEPVEVFRHDPPGGRPGRSHTQALFQLDRLEDGRIYSWANGTLVIWDPRTHHIQAQPIPSRDVTRAASFPDGLVAMATGDGGVLLWAPGGDAPPREVYSHGQPLTHFEATPTGWLISRCKAGMIRIWKPGLDGPWDVASDGDAGDSAGLCVLPDGMIFLADRDGLRICDPQAREVRRWAVPLVPGIQFVTPAPDEDRIYIGGPMGVASWSPYRGEAGEQRLVFISRGFPRNVSVMRAAPSGRVILGFGDGRVLVADLKTLPIETRSWHEYFRAEQEEQEQWERKLMQEPLSDAEFLAGAASMSWTSRVTFSHVDAEARLAAGFDRGEALLLDFSPAGLARIREAFAALGPIDTNDEVAMLAAFLRHGATTISLQMAHEDPEVWSVESAGFLPDGRAFGIGSAREHRNRLVAVDLSTWDPTWANFDYRSIGRPILMLPDGRILFALYGRRPEEDEDPDTYHLGFWDPAPSGCSGPLPPIHVATVTHLEPWLDGGCISAGADGRVVHWNAVELFEPRGLYVHRSAVDHLVVTGDAIVSADSHEVVCWAPDRKAAVVCGLERSLDCLRPIDGGRILMGDRWSLGVQALGSREFLEIDRPGCRLCDAVVLAPGRVAYGDEYGRVKVWTAPPVPIRYRPDPPAIAICAAGGDRLALLHAGGRLSIWNPATGASEPGPSIDGEATCLLSVDKSRILIGLACGRVLDWRPGGTRLGELCRHPAAVAGLDRLSDGRIVLRGADGAAVLLGAGRALVRHHRPITALECLPDGRLLIADDSGALLVQDEARESFVAVLHDECLVTAMAVLPQPDGRLVLGYSDGGIYREGPTDGGWAKIGEHPLPATDLVPISPGRLAIRDREGRVAVLDLEAGRPVPEAGRGPGIVTGLAAISDGRLVLGCREGSLSVQGPMGEPRPWPRIPFQPARHLAPLGGDWLATADDQGRIVVSHPDAPLSDWSAYRHPRPITCLGPGGDRRILFGDDQGFVYAWDGLPDQTPVEITRHRGEVRGLAVRPDGRIISMSGGRVRINERPDGEAGLSRLDLSRARFSFDFPMAALEDGRLFLPLDDSESLLWDPSSGEVRGVPGFAGIRSAAAGRGASLIVGGRDGSVTAWDLSSDERTVIHREHRDAVGAVALLPGGIVISGGDDGRVFVHDPAAGVTTLWWESEGAVRIAAIAIAGDDLVVQAGSTIIAAPMVPGGPGDPRVRLEHWHGPLAVEPDGRGILLCGLDGRVARWEPASGADPAEVRPPDGRAGLVDLFLALPGRRVLLGRRFAAAHVVGLDGGSAEEPDSFLDSWIDRALVLPDGRVALRGFDRAHVWDPGRGRGNAVLSSGGVDYEGLAPRPDGTLLLRRADGIVVERPAEGGGERFVGRRPGRIGAVAWGPDGKLAVMGTGWPLTSWDPATGRSERLPGPASPPRCLRPLPDGRLAIGRRDGTVSLSAPWGSGDARRLSALFDRHDSPAVGLVLLEGGRLASLDAEGALVVGTLSRPEDVAVIHEHDQEVCRLLALPDGWLASASTDGTVLVWEPAGGRRTLLPTFRPVRDLHWLRMPRDARLLVVMDQGPILGLRGMLPKAHPT